MTSGGVEAGIRTFKIALIALAVTSAACLVAMSVTASQGRVSRHRTPAFLYGHALHFYDGHKPSYDHRQKGATLTAIRIRRAAALLAGMTLLTAGCGGGQTDRTPAAVQDAAAPGSAAPATAPATNGLDAVEPDTAPGTVLSRTVVGDNSGGHKFTMPGFYTLHVFVSGGEDRDELYDAAGQQVSWFPGGGEVPDLEASDISVNDSGMFARGMVSAGGLAGSSSALVRLDPLRGSIMWATPIPEDSEFPLFNSTSVVVHTGDSFLAFDTASGKQLFDVPAASTGALMAYTDDVLITGVPSDDVSGTYTLHDVRNGAKTGTVSGPLRYGGRVTPSFTDLPQRIQDAVRGDEAAQPLLSGGGFDHSNDSVVAYAADGTTRWSVPAPDATVVAASNSRVLVKGSSGDLVTLDAADGKQLATLPPVGDCSDGGFVAERRVALDCRDQAADTGVVLLVAV